MTFRDLTDNKITPPEAKSVLGIGMKFIQTPKYTTSDLSTTLPENWDCCENAINDDATNDGTSSRVSQKERIGSNLDKPGGFK